MRNKLLLFSLLAGLSLTVMVVAAGVTIYAFTTDTTPAVEEAAIQQSPEQAPVNVEPVANKYHSAAPALKHSQASYAGKPGGCSYQSAKQPLVETPNETVEDQVLSLAQ